MKNLHSLLIAGCFVAITFLHSGCMRPVEGVGPTVIKTLNPGTFDELVVKLPVSITLVISDSAAAVISAQENIIELIQLNNDDGKLTIECDKDFRSTLPVQITLATNALSKIVINGSGDLKVVNPVRGEDLRVVINGAGDVDLMADVIKLRTEMNGSGDVHYAGKAGDHRIKMNGSGNIEAADLSVEKCDIRINGSGDANLHVNEMLEAKILGSGNVRYSGSPEVSSKITGSGDVSKK